MTTRQIKTFWPAFAAACRELGLSTRLEQEEYRRSIMRQTANAGHLADVSPTTGYEALMMRVKADAGDYEGASAFLAGNARRMCALVNDCARQVFELAGATGDRIKYIRGIIEQSGETSANLVADPLLWFMDYPETTQQKIFQILDTHRRRLLWRRERETGVHLPARYQFGTVYRTIEEIMP